MLKEQLWNDYTKSIAVNCGIYLILIVVSLLFKIYVNIEVAGFFLIASTILISINVMNFYQIYSEKDHLEFVECLKAGFFVGSISWFMLYLILFLPSIIISIYKTSIVNYTEELNLVVILSIILGIICISAAGCITSGISILFSPIFTGQKPDLKYYLTWLGLLSTGLIQLIAFIVFILLPVFEKIP